MSGVIALDIDGTVSFDCQPISKAIEDRLAILSNQNWAVVFVTGRTFQWSRQAIKKLSFPFHLAVQNGAALLEMPTKKLVAKKYLQCDILSDLDEICAACPSDYVVYGGVDTGDLCYYRPGRFAVGILEYVEDRQRALGEELVAVESFATLREFGSIKCFGDRVAMELVQASITERLDLHAPIICDPYRSAFHILQATHRDVNKGAALQDFCALVGNKGPIIAAGDDFNDQAMLAAADIAIAMETAPEFLQHAADIIAPATEKGIIQALEQALAQVR